MGIYSGHYRLNFSNESSRVAALKLMEANNREQKKRKMERHCDTSQKGNWTNFRNEKANEIPHTIYPKFFLPCPNQGSAEFDYISTTIPEPDAVTISDARLMEVLQMFDIIMPWELKSRYHMLNVYHIGERSYQE